MKVGDLVKVRTLNRFGVRIEQKDPLPIGLDVFYVLIQDGVIRMKTSAAIVKCEEVIDESWGLS